MIEFTTIKNKEKYANKPVFIVGGGPSLKGFDFDRIREFNTIGINDSGLISKTDILFSLDRTWINMRHKEISSFDGEVYCAIHPTIQRFKHIPNVNYIKRERCDTLYLKNDGVAGFNSGFGGLNLAYLLDCNPIILLGIDMGRSEKLENHWHEEYGWSQNSSNDRYSTWAKQFDRSFPLFEASGKMVLNASKISTIERFTKKDIDEILRSIQCE